MQEIQYQLNKTLQLSYYLIFDLITFDVDNISMEDTPLFGICTLVENFNTSGKPFFKIATASLAIIF